MEKDMEKEKNIIKMANYNLKVNFLMVLNGMEKGILKMVIYNLN